MPTRSTVDPALLDQLRQRRWPGNLRELRNFVERVAALGTEGALAVTAREDPSGVHSARPRDWSDLLSGGYLFKEARDLANDEFECAYLREAIAKYGRHSAVLGDAMGVAASYVRKLLQKHDL